MAVLLHGVPQCLPTRRCAGENLQFATAVIIEPFDMPLAGCSAIDSQRFMRFVCARSGAVFASNSLTNRSYCRAMSSRPSGASATVRRREEARGYYS
jgi:hypothetical protein